MYTWKNEEKLCISFEWSSLQITALEAITNFYSLSNTHVSKDYTNLTVHNLQSSYTKNTLSNIKLKIVTMKKRVYLRQIIESVSRIDIRSLSRDPK